jgi:hypothetical protein
VRFGVFKWAIMNHLWCKYEVNSRSPLFRLLLSEERA